VRATIGGILLGLTAVHPALALVAWHAALWLAASAGTVTGWALHQPAAVVALAAVAGWRHAKRSMRRRTT
jgi:hypothetical protein